MAYLVHDCGNCFQHDWRALGHLLAYVDWPRHLLDTGAHHDSDERRAGGHRLWVHDSDDHVWPGRDATKRFFKDLGISRTAGSVHRNVGLYYDADFRAFRQLVAQRVRPGREDFESATHAALAGIIRNQSGGTGADGGLAKPRRRICAAKADMALRVCGRGLRRTTRDDANRRYVARNLAQRWMLLGGGDWHSASVGRRGLGIEPALGLYAGGGNLHCNPPGVRMDSAADSCSAEAGAGLPEHYASRSVAFPAAPDR